jgi:hypothetical protein
MDRLYSTPSWQLAITLFVILLGGMFVGFQLGKNAARHGEQESGAADSSVKGAVAGLAALLLSLAAPIFALLVTLVVSVILDLDRPRRGVIRENISPLENLRLTVRGGQVQIPTAGAAALPTAQ